MRKYKISKDDIVQRVYFITKLVQQQTGSTMQGALTSKSDSMGGIFDRFINTISDTLVFNKIILANDSILNTNKQVSVIEDFYYYKPTSNGAGIAPDIFGLRVNERKIPFTKFNNKWTPEPNRPQIEVKTFKAKDQMISLRNQNYDNEYLVLVDLDMRIDYLVPFLNGKILSESIPENMVMDDDLFIVRDDKNRISKITPIDFSRDEIGTLELIAITNATDFMSQATFCNSNISVRRMKEINERKALLKSNLLSISLFDYSRISPRNENLYEFNEKWMHQFKIKENVRCLDFSASNIKEITILRFNSNGIVIRAEENGCSFNNTKLIKGKQYTVKFDTLDRSGNGGCEYFMQKQCANQLRGVENQLITELIKIINEEA